MAEADEPESAKGKAAFGLGRRDGDTMDGQAARRLLRSLLAFAEPSRIPATA